MAGRKRKFLNEGAKYYDFAKRLDDLMKLNNFNTQGPLAIKLKTTAGEIGNWLAGKRIPTLEEHWKGLSDNLHTTVDFLLLGKGDKLSSQDEQILKYYKVIWTNNLEKIPEINQDDFIPVPLVSCKIAAGTPVIPEENVEDIVLIHVSEVGKGRNLVAIRIEKGPGEIGKSMLPILNPGDIIVIDRNDKTEIKNKAIYAVRIKMGDQVGCTVKYLERPKEEMLLLRPENKDFSVEILDLKENPDPIIGRVIWVWKSFK